MNENVIIPMNPEEECILRNAFLCAQCNNMPSYGLWRETDIIDSTLNERIMWWTSQMKENAKDKLVKNYLQHIARRLLHRDTE